MESDSRNPNDEQRPDRGGRSNRRRYARMAVPVGVLAVGGLTAGLVPALADSGGPSLPAISAQALMEEMAASKTDTFSGTVKSSVDLGLPALPGSLGGAVGGLGGGSEPSSSSPSSSASSPQSHALDLASGTHTLRVAADGPDRQSVALVEDLAEYRVIHNGADAWAYDSQNNTVWHHKSTAAEQKAHDGKGAAPSEGAAETPKAAADRLLKLAGPTTKVSVDGTSTVAGRSAYDLVLTPKSSGSTVGSVTIAVDSKQWVPLKVTVTTRSGGSPAVDIGFTKVSFAKPSAALFDFKAPAGAKVTEDKADAKKRPGAKTAPPAAPAPNAKGGKGGGDGTKTFGTGWSTVYRVAGASDALSGKPAKSGKSGGGEGSSVNLKGLLGEVGTKVTDDFGSGTVVRSRLINVLVTDSGKVYAGAVSTGDLVKAANADK